MPTAILADRAIIDVSGPDAEHFLQNILTLDLDALGRNEAKPGALLAPQGKIMFDFLVSRSTDNAHSGWNAGPTLRMISSAA
jgi:folate-binding Fe-S cluster repair protein YgfZ